MSVLKPGNRVGETAGRDTLADYLAEGLEIVSIGLNPSLSAVREGYYFATPQNRFWRALNASGLIDEPLTPGVAAMQQLLQVERIGFTDVVKRPSASGKVLRAADYRQWAPVLREKLLHYRPCIAWFHGKQACQNYLRYVTGKGAEGSASATLEWGAQPWRIGPIQVFVTPNPSPANAAFSLAVITEWFARLQQWRVQVCKYAATG